MPRTLANLKLRLQSETHITAVPLHERECAKIRSQIAALTNLQSISIAGPGAAACFPYGPNLAATFSHLTALRLSTIRSHAEVAQLLPALPTSLVHLSMDVDTLACEDSIYKSSTEQVQQLQRSVQLAHLTALKELHITGDGFVVGEDTQLPPNIEKLTVPWLVHFKPLLELSRLQHLNAGHLLGPAQLGVLVQGLTQLTHMEANMMWIGEDEAPEVVSALAALPLKSLGLEAFGPPGEGATAGLYQPAIALGLLGQLTSLTSLRITAGAYHVADVAACLASLTGLQQLVLDRPVAAGQGPCKPTLYGGSAEREGLMHAVVSLPQLRCLKLDAGWLSLMYSSVAA
jgi:hypothetical protein